MIRVSPPPWHVCLSKRGVHKECASVIDGEGKAVCNTVYRSRRGEHSANAHLISAAPEMYSILYVLLVLVKSGRFGSEIKDVFTKPIEDVLRKARGDMSK